MVSAECPRGRERRALRISSGVPGSDPASPAQPAPRMVLLCHELPDGSWHFDWMIETPGQAEGPLRTLRVHERPDAADRFTAELLPDHRRAYLDYEGPVSGGRGTVRRVASGIVERLALGPERIEILGTLAGATRRWIGVRDGGSAWAFESRPA